MHVGRIVSRVCPHCCDELFPSAEGRRLTCHNRHLHLDGRNYYEPLPPDLALRQMGQPELPGLEMAPC